MMLQFDQEQSLVEEKRSMGEAVLPLTNPIPPVPSATVVVPTEELAAALRSLAERRQSEANAAAEIADLAQTLDRIGVAAEPSEVWHELAAQRTLAQTLEAQKTAEVSQRKQERRRLRSAAIATLSLILVALSVRTIIEQYRDYREEQIHKIAMKQSMTHSIAQLPAVPKMTVMPVYESMFRMTPTTKSVDTIPNGMAFRSDLPMLTNLSQLLYGNSYQKAIPASETKGLMIETAPPMEKGAWEVVRLEGKFYLRGWVKERVSPNQLIPSQPGLGSPGMSQDPNKSLVTIYNSPEAESAMGLMVRYQPGVTNATPVKPQPLTQISIPLDGFEMRSVTRTENKANAMLTIHHLDSHAYDQWKPLPLPPAATPTSP